MFEVWLQMSDTNIDRENPSDLPALVVRNLGVWLHTDFSVSRHIQNTCNACFAQIPDFKHLIGYLMMIHDAAFMAANALVDSQVDYSATSLYLFRKNWKTYFFAKTYLP